MNPVELAEILRGAFTAAPPLYANERDLQEAIANALTGQLPPGVHAAREHVLTKRDRLDFLVGYNPMWTATPLGTAIEVKIDGSLSDLTRQLFRYAEHPAISGLLVVTTRSRHRALPPLILGKPIAVLFTGDFML